MNLLMKGAALAPPFSCTTKYSSDVYSPRPPDIRVRLLPTKPPVHFTTEQPGRDSKDKINLVAGAITQPFAEMVWVTTGGDMETINRLTDVLVSMNTPADRGKLFKIIKMLYALMGLPFSEEAEPMDAAPDVLEYFIFSFTADFGEIIKDYIAEAQ